jgi:hypothetical protein
MKNGSSNGSTSSAGSSPDPAEKKIKKLLSASGVSGQDKQFLETVIQTDVGERYLEFMGPELSRAHQLANRDSNEYYEFTQLVKKRTFEFLANHPPEGSEMTGPFRALVYADSKEPLSNDDLRLVEALEQLIISKGSGGRNMAQQEIIKVMRQEIDRVSETRNGGSGGFFSRLMGGK